MSRRLPTWSRRRGSATDQCRYRETAKRLEMHTLANKSGWMKDDIAHERDSQRTWTRRNWAFAVAHHLSRRRRSASLSRRRREAAVVGASRDPAATSDPSLRCAKDDERAMKSNLRSWNHKITPLARGILKRLVFVWFWGRNSFGDFCGCRCPSFTRLAGAPSACFVIFSWRCCVTLTHSAAVPSNFHLIGLRLFVFRRKLGSVKVAAVWHLQRRPNEVGFIQAHCSYRFSNYFVTHWGAKVHFIFGRVTMLTY